MADNNATIDPTLTMLTPEPAGPHSSEIGSTTNAGGDKKDPKNQSGAIVNPLLVKANFERCMAHNLKFVKEALSLSRRVFQFTSPLTAS